MSRDVRDILVERCTFLGTDVGIRLKSALGRGGRIENITIRDIDMMQIKQEAVILTMSYQLNLLDKNEEIIQEKRKMCRILMESIWSGFAAMDVRQQSRSIRWPEEAIRSPM